MSDRSSMINPPPVRRQSPAPLDRSTQRLPIKSEGFDDPKVDGTRWVVGGDKDDKLGVERKLSRQFVQENNRSPKHLELRAYIALFAEKNKLLKNLSGTIPNDKLIIPPSASIVDKSWATSARATPTNSQSVSLSTFTPSASAKVSVEQATLNQLTAASNDLLNKKPLDPRALAALKVAVIDLSDKNPLQKADGTFVSQVRSVFGDETAARIKSGPPPKA